MSFCDLHWFSNVLGKAVNTWVLLPDTDVKGPYPVFYLLHGLSDDNTIWLRRTRIECYVSGLPLIVVMPDGGRGFYCDHANGPHWGEHIAKELPDFIEKTFHARTDGNGRAIGGLSMGGYGALRLAMGNPGRYCSVNCHSGCLTYAHVKYEFSTPGREAEYRAMVGEKDTGGPFDLFTATEECLKTGLVPKIKIDHGTEDWLLPQAREYSAFLKKLGIEHEYNEYPGNHNWDFWDTHIREALEFHAKNLGIAKS